MPKAADGQTAFQLYILATCIHSHILCISISNIVKCTCHTVLLERLEY